MANVNDQEQAKWEIYHLRMARQIADQMERAVEAGEVFTKQLQEQNKLLAEQNSLLEDREWNQQESEAQLWSPSSIDVGTS